MYRMILRLLDAERNVLAWNQLFCEAKGDGSLRATQDFLAEGDVPGIATDLSVHWVDVNVHMTHPLPQPLPVEPGKVIGVPTKGQAMFVLTGDARPLPGVTLRQSVKVSVGSFKA